VLGVFLWLFGPALLTDRCFVYRDAGHYYDPLFEFTSAQWGEGRVPLWNPYDGNGKPLLADTTSSVLYPGKLVFALPLSHATNYKVYICGHVLLAAATAMLLARRWGASIGAAGVCGLSYAFCGNVVFQYCNVVFLVGAAWLPVAVLATDRLLVTRRLRWAPVLGCVLALMTFGGDPQAAYNAGLMAAGYAILLWLSQRRARKRRGDAAAVADAARPDSRGTGSQTAGPPKACPTAGDRESSRINSAPPCPARPRRRFTHRLVLLAAAAACGSVLAAAQILPAVAWSARSHRAAFAVPRTIYEIPRYLARSDPPETQRDAFAGLLANPAPGEHLEHAYFFSVSPWRLLEYVWPNISGRSFPVHRRWINIIPAEGREWTPTLYMGLLPLLLAVSSLRLRRSPVRYRWMSWTVVFAVVASFGWYGIGWLAIECWCVFGGDPDSLPFGPAVGGVYWLFTTVLPGYIYFRYPAKLLVLAALGLSVLAARGWDSAFAGRLPRLRTVLLMLAGTSLVAIIAVLVTRPYWATWFAPSEPSVLFGPFDPAGASTGVLIALLHTAVLCGLLYLLLPRGQTYVDPNRGTVRRTGFSRNRSVDQQSRRRKAAQRTDWGKKRPMTWRSGIVLLLTAIEIAVAQSWLVPTAPRKTWQDPGPLVAAIRGNSHSADEWQGVRVDRAAPRHWFHPQWKATSSSRRLAEALALDNASLMPRFHLPRRIGLLDAHGTIMSQDYATFLLIARSGGPQRVGRGRHLPAAFQDALGADYMILRGVEPPPPGMSLASQLPNPNGPQPWATVWRNERPHPRVWIAEQVTRRAPLPNRHPQLVRQRTQDVLFSGSGPRDLQRTAFVETDRSDFERIAGLDDWQAARGDNAPAPANGRIVAYRSQRVEIEATLDRPGLLVLSDFYDSGWRAEIMESDAASLRAGQNVPVLRTNRIMRGIFLPAGTHRIQYVYRPRSFYVGAIVSIIGWAALGLGRAWMCLRSWRNRRPNRR
jgi:hypothetical protein